MDTCPACGTEFDPDMLAGHTETTHGIPLDDRHALIEKNSQTAADRMTSHLSAHYGFSIVDLGDNPPDDGHRPAQRQGGYL